jgi:hypothetical protein
MVIKGFRPTAILGLIVALLLGAGGYMWSVAPEYGSSKPNARHHATPRYWTPELGWLSSAIVDSNLEFLALPGMQASRSPAVYGLRRPKGGRLNPPGIGYSVPGGSC